MGMTWLSLMPCTRLITPVEYVILADLIAKPSKLFDHSCYLIVINLFSDLLSLD